jgi:hypothetical protein
LIKVYDSLTLPSPTTFARTNKVFIENSGGYSSDILGGGNENDKHLLEQIGCHVVPFCISSPKINLDRLCLLV